MPQNETLPVIHASGSPVRPRARSSLASSSAAMKPARESRAVRSAISGVGTMPIRPREVSGWPTKPVSLYGDRLKPPGDLEVAAPHGQQLVVACREIVDGLRLYDREQDLNIVAAGNPVEGERSVSLDALIEVNRCFDRIGLPVGIAIGGTCHPIRKRCGRLPACG